MCGAGRRTKRPLHRAIPGMRSRHAPLTALVVALSLLFQLVTIPYHQALLAAGVAAPDTAAIAAELRATFGDSASLCTQSDDNGAPASPVRDCDDHCPFCRFAAQAATLTAPVAPALPVRFDTSSRTLGAAPEPGAFPVSPTKRSRARAPPAAI